VHIFLIYINLRNIQSILFFMNKLLITQQAMTSIRCRIHVELMLKLSYRYRYDTNLMNHFSLDIMFMFLSIYISLISSIAGYRPLPTFSTWSLEGRKDGIKTLRTCHACDECTYIYIHLYMGEFLMPNPNDDCKDILGGLRLPSEKWRSNKISCKALDILK